MKLIIDIPEQDYELACKYPDVLFGSYGRAIAKGTPLPKGHGRLIDANALDKDFSQCTCEGGCRFLTCPVYDAKTIVEADEEES